MGRSFAPIADSLREEVSAFYERRGIEISGGARTRTLETNSGLAERRGRLLLDLLAVERGTASLAGQRVVDVGCGFGALGALFAAEGASVTGVDPEPERFEVGEAIARRHGLDMHFVRARMEALDELPHARFDVAIVNNSLCYLIAPALRARALREILRVLHPSGWAVLRNPNRLSPVDPFTGLPLLSMLPAEHAARLAARLGRPRSSVVLTTPARARAELRAAGFERVRMVEPGRLGPLRRATRYHHAVARRPLS